MTAMNVNAAGSKATCRVNPDPHFMTWDGIYYDYHGGCDLVLIQNPVFDGGDEFDLHIRTVPQNSWGGISNAVLQIGTDKLEVQDDGSTFFNGVLVNPTTLTIMGNAGYSISYATTTSQDVWEVTLSGGQYVRIMNYDYGGLTAGSISIEVYADDSEFNSSVGMCGTWTTPGLIARNGLTDYQTVPPPGAGIQMGQEWQVLASEDQLFQSYGPSVILPGNTCLSPPPPGSGGDIRREDAEDACEHVEGENFNNCVFDVMATQNFAWAQAPFYFKYQCTSKRNLCKRKGGRCMEQKDCDSKTHFCRPNLCYAKKVPVWLHDLDHAAATVTRRLTSERQELSTQFEDDSQTAVDILRRSTQANGIIDGPALSDFRDPCVCAIPKPFQSGECCKFTGPLPFNCAAIDAMIGVPGADIDGRCNAVQGGNACAWDYSNPDCCEIAMNDAICKLPNEEAEEACKCALEKRTIDSTGVARGIRG
eukprot:CAMPEP_0113525790 /NCGR_PEP_ID=MMETSP0015_2-20120614/369_1 /TAXON_ID=2838 /ORGANISM="Odontella" /LENGTH=476 /DNA_ID=CAMNT_0000424019 /DNA_START=42 /DNA_END=1472 /DNA_ORIENTATION=- /assembly_acc=CAM_ASM_000160